MRFIYLILGILFVISIIILLIGEVLGINLYLKYGNQILKLLYKFLLLIICLYITLSLIGLNHV